MLNYDDAGRVTATRDARGLKTSYAYDEAGRRAWVTNADQKVFHYEYDLAGNLRFVTDPLQHKTEYQYDDSNRRAVVVFPDLTQEVTAYDDLGRRTQVTDQAGVATQYGYDGLGRLTSVSNAVVGSVAQATTLYSYDEAGNMTKQQDAENRVTKLEYDALGRRTRRTLPLGQTETFGYDDLGQMTRHLDFNGKLTLFYYDEAGRLTNKTPDISFGVDPVVFTYMPSGQRASMKYPTGPSPASEEVDYEYREDGRLWKKEAPQGTITYAYDENGNVTQISTSHGTTVAYGWDSLNRLSTVTNDPAGTPKVTTYHYDDAGNLNDFGYPNGVTHTYHYNTLNRLTDMAVANSGGQIASFNYNPSDRLLGAAGNRRAVRETIGSMTRSVNYDYDSLYRLTVETIVSGTPSGSIVYDNGTGYVGYDHVGNRRSRKVSTALQSAALTDFNNASFGVNDWLNTSSYDANGNTTVESLPSPAISPTTSYPDQYDFENRLTKRWNSTTTITIVYDGDGNRIRKTMAGISRHYLVDDLNPTGYAQVQEEAVGTEPATATLSRAYAYGHSLISQSRSDASPAWSPEYYGYDGHGNVRFLTAGSGVISDTYTYDAFGILLSPSTPPANNNYLFACEQYDRDLGLYNNRSRWGNPTAGRFWTFDSFEGTLGDPLSLHKYLYCGGSPIDNTDPSGHGDLPSLSATMTIMTYIALNLYVEYGPAINRGVVVVYEATTGSASIVREGETVLAAATLAKVEGGLATWAKAVGNLKGILIGPKAYVSELLRGTGRQASHLNQAGAYTGIRYEAGACLDLAGNALKSGTEHNQFHLVMEGFWAKYRKGGAKFGLKVSNRAYLEVLRDALTAVKDAATGAQKFTQKQIDAMVELAEKEQRGYGYFDGRGGLSPEVPKSMNLK